MEPVPETEKMQEFRDRASPVPRLGLLDIQEASTDEWGNNKPLNIRRSTEPTPQSPRSPITASPLIPYRPRNTSPYSRGHLRSKSSTSSLAPAMSRAQSMPGINTAGHLALSAQRNASPIRSPVRTPRKPADEVFPGLPNRSLVDISEVESPGADEHTPRATERSASPILGLPPSSSNHPPRTRRPSSPLRYLVAHNSAAGSTAPSTPSSVSSSPSYQSSRFSDTFLGPGGYGTYSYPGSFASSSVPSTPTSARSRSPSISSLETIPDSPDAEEAALEADRIAQLKAAADAADGVEENKPRVAESSGRGRSLVAAFGRDKRKRWSVCGAERRGDLNLDTIWEDGS